MELRSPFTNVESLDDPPYVWPPNDPPYVWPSDAPPLPPDGPPSTVMFSTTVTEPAPPDPPDGVTLPPRTPLAPLGTPGVPKHFE
ncbi:hypothetical protein AVEN_155419-1 [Araneus ventricosus]|uniref:Uncharacterized protein n=1 Tax=Araneus ventricosus TaxID=182803 RepID=A0A4Y2MMK6_ARAVE|nr:hypothetical protein AVEN_155419-1 [Araneus ventricosus]